MTSDRVRDADPAEVAAHGVVNLEVVAAAADPTRRHLTGPATVKHHDRDDQHGQDE